MTLIEHQNQINFKLEDIPEMNFFKNIAMVSPENFDIKYSINPFMMDSKGNLKKINHEKATLQWGTLLKIFKKLNLKTKVFNFEEKYPDMVFCANQFLPIPKEISINKEDFLEGKMFAEERKNEVPLLKKAMESSGYHFSKLSSKAKTFEGTGDGIWHPGKRLLWGGVGKRTDLETWKEISQKYNLDIVALNLEGNTFYHLDTCFCILDSSTCLWNPDAFDEDGRKMIQALFEKTIRADEKESKELMACNAFCPDGKNVIIQQGCLNTKSKLEEAGFNVVEADTSEFIKAGGSVFCLKLFF